MTRVEEEYAAMADGNANEARRYAVHNSLRRAARELRDLEDFARLTLNDDLLAQRVRDVYETIADDIYDGGWKRSRAERARLWDRYCCWRGHDPHAGASRRNRRKQLRKVAK